MGPLSSVGYSVSMVKAQQRNVLHVQNQTHNWDADKISKGSCSLSGEGERREKELLQGRRERPDLKWVYGREDKADMRTCDLRVGWRCDINRPTPPNGPVMSLSHLSLFEGVDFTIQNFEIAHVNSVFVWTFHLTLHKQHSDLSVYQLYWCVLLFRFLCCINGSECNCMKTTKDVFYCIFVYLHPFKHHVIPERSYTTFIL